jgi:hypothetical protein
MHNRKHRVAVLEASHDKSTPKGPSMAACMLPDLNFSAKEQTAPPAFGHSMKLFAPNFTAANPNLRPNSGLPLQAVGES